jgi:hypothetical protein
MTVAAIGKLHFDHDTESFDCGKPELNNFLRRFALSNQRSLSRKMSHFQL